MRNLVLVNQKSWKVPTGNPGIFCIDAITRSIYHINSEEVYCFKIGDCGTDSLLAITWKDHDICTSNVIAADVITANDCICVVTGDGDVITVDKETQEVEVVGSVDAGIHAACWSPDQELLILVTNNAKVVVMTAIFDAIAEYSLNQDDFGENKFINVGWGKKETQFHGSEGKEAAKVVKRTVKAVHPLDDRRPRISWRGDGQLFVVSYVRQDTDSRCLRVFNREGILQYTSEDVDGLENVVSWKPSGSLIASSRRLSNKHEIIFFEKNGLKHGEFPLPFKSTEMLLKDVAWNQDSNILLVWLKPIEGTERWHSAKSVIQLWTVGNYHWYLKQELSFKEEVRYLSWDNENPLLLHLLTLNHLHHYTWVVTTNKSCGFGPLDLAHVAVIDGQKLLMTPFRQSGIPPPMSAYEITFTGQINAVMFAPPVVKVCEASPDNSQCVEDSGFLETLDPPGCNSNNLCVFHGSETLTFLTQAHADDILDDYGCGVRVTGAGGNGYSVQVKVHRVIAQHKIEWDPEQIMLDLEFSKFCSWVWAAKNTLLACYKTDDACSVVIMDLQGIGSEPAQVIVKAVLPTEVSIVSISPAPDGTVAVLQLECGSLLKLDLQTRMIEPLCVNGKDIRFPSVCEQVSLCPVKDGSQFMPLGLTCRNRLYWGYNQLLANCTSYHIHTDHLLVTTTNHILEVMPLMESYMSKRVAGGAEDCGVAGSRKVERGSRIVTAVPQDTRVVLQMPRGNLEVVNPRPLAIHTLKQLLNEHKYYQAMDIIRKQRVDLNLIYDHNPAEFLANITHFVQNVDNPHRIDLFIASLSEVDFTTTTYSFNYSNRQHHDNKTEASGGKIDMVCEALREAMISVDEEKFLLPILTSYVKMTSSQMDVALKKIQEIKDIKDKKFKVSAEEGLRHLLYIADVNELYDVALGTYDFDLVMMVAEKSQKDPKEYLPFLNELKQFEENYRKFKINVYLRRHQKALECLRDSDDHAEECLNLIVSEKLYKEALQIFPPSSEMNKAVCERYGIYLMAKQYYNEAGVMYTRADKLDDALNAYQKAGNWKMILIVGAQLNFNNEEMNVLCCTLVESLKNRNNYVDAAWVYEEYLKNEEEALDCLVKGSQWDDALRVAYKYHRLDLVDTNIKPGAEEQYRFCTAEIERLASIFTQYCSRLAVVRESKEKQHLDMLEGNCEGQLDCDLYSDTSTVTGMSYSRSHATGSRTGTSHTGKTFRSSKNKKKLERKKFSTKEGGAYEDLGLVSALYELLTTANGMTASVMALCTILVTFKMDREAICLQTSFSALLTLMDRKKAEIWPASVPLHNEEPEFGPQLTTEGVVNRIRGGGNGDVSFVAQRMRELDPHLRHPPPVNRLSNWSLYMLR
ncbi:putative elongator complex protein 1 [Homarus americanus]|uniref:Elongator complex protein 1 n=1 Tax=Homarus americanus TaxID=6706 RepID=A0A8J5JWT7_HOMAM|nr:putative elongator complex protein 1 [Homarus americanus]XP_042231675.1 putative elongator complex protein 1 [Homarus americanus]KAG7163721.1 Elongator complex protein 1-like [Homarus americanus]